MFRFESFHFLMWLLLLPTLAIVAWIWGKWHLRKIQKSIHPRLLPYLTQSLSLGKRRWKYLLQLVCLFFMILAWARPQSGESVQKIKSEGVEIILAVDVSESMMAEDVKPSRLEQVKAELNKMVDLMPGNKMGVLAFAGSAALLSPLTNDPAAVRMYIDSLATNAVSTQGTNFQEALRVASEAFERGGAQTDEVVKVTRVILLVSDGEDHEPGAEELAENLVDKGVRIFGLAYGTEKGAGIPIRDSMGFLKGYKKDRSGETVLSRVNGEAIRELTEKGKGSFFFASFGGDHIQNLVEDINQLEKTEFENSVATQYDENFQIFVLLAILIGLVELILGERRRSFQIWKGRFEVPTP
ncbi:MAG: vWA domain-containing protein [Bdellovibrionia bacterium]